MFVVDGRDGDPRTAADGKDRSVPWNDDCYCVEEYGARFLLDAMDVRCGDWTWLR